MKHAFVQMKAAAFSERIGKCGWLIIIRSCSVCSKVWSDLRIDCAHLHVELQKMFMDNALYQHLVEQMVQARSIMEMSLSNVVEHVGAENSEQSGLVN